MYQLIENPTPKLTLTLDEVKLLCSLIDVDCANEKITALCWKLQAFSVLEEDLYE